MTRVIENKSKESQYLPNHPDAYDRVKSSYFNTLDKVLAFFPPEKRQDLTCLDVGSGMGLFLAAMNERGLKACGIEPQADLIELSLENCEYLGFRPDVRQGFAEDIPFGDEMFDIVICNSVLEHVNDWERTIEECLRVLKPGGVLFIETTNRQHPRQWEVNDFPFFSWLPHRIQRRYVDYCLRKRPDKINYTPIPVRFFFTHRQLRKACEARGARVYDRFDRFNPAWFRGRKRFLKPITKLFRYGFVKWVLYFFTPMTKIYIVKGGRAKPAASPATMAATG